MVPDDLKYTEKHEWIRVEGDTGTIGITEYARNQLGDIVYLELPSAGTKVTRGGSFGTVEAVKAVSDIYSPVTGEVTEVNDDLAADPSKIKDSPYGEGWMIKVRIDDKSELDALLEGAKYKELIGD
jgi:glycine cleavage system H protein